MINKKEFKLNVNDLLTDDEVESMTYQILKFFDDNPLTPDELTDQLYKAAKWGTEAKLNDLMLRMVVRGKLAMGFDKTSNKPQFKRLTPEVEAAPAQIADLDEDEDVDWWER